MTKHALLACSCLLLLLCSAGCTDFVEPNQLAFVMGSSIDHADNGQIEVGHQIVIPSLMSGTAGGSGSGNADSFLVMTAKGKDVYDASMKVQMKMSRKMLTSHRVLIALSEEYVRDNDMSELFDKLVRDPANNLRDTMVLIRGGKAKDFMMLKHPMEHLSSIAADKEMQINGIRNFSSRQMVIDHLADGVRPLIPVLQFDKYNDSPDESTPIAVLAGFAALDKQLKVKGILSSEDGMNAVWMAGKGTFMGLTVPWKDGKSHLSFRLTHLGRRISSNGGDGRKKIGLTVKAQAYLIENTTSLDMSNVDNMIEMRKYVDEVLGKKLQLTMDKVQRWGTDIFGIGEYYHRKSPEWWNSQKDHWDENFGQVDAKVSAKITIRSVGVSGGNLD